MNTSVYHFTSPFPGGLFSLQYTKHDAAQVRDKILELIRGGTCFVPLICSDTTGPYAKVGTPYSPTSPYRFVPEIEGAVRQEQYHQQQPLSHFTIDRCALFKCEIECGASCYTTRIPSGCGLQLHWQTWSCKPGLERL
ncbi:hypothetical protein ElyMa_002924100 [Elysia marginata]|uniref:Uncharacterized protein n=1 Tax=Elysia marginata TaxID=1093978 RepID=A0AAV4I3W0_9GAST|nr:hypothetical protein ElyMa_002924100 [Elysia marginata]